MLENVGHVCHKPPVHELRAEIGVSTEGREGEGRRKGVQGREEDTDIYLLRAMTSIKSFLSAASSTLSSVPLSQSMATLVHSVRLHSAQ